MLILSIYHSIFLKADEIEKLVSGETIKVIGVSLPVWYLKGSTSEPAEEVFCKYTLTNKPGKLPIKVKPDGYVINMPQVPEEYIAPIPISNEEWQKLSSLEQELWYNLHKIPHSAKNLLPLSQNGAEYLYFKEYKRTKSEAKNTTLAHMIEIRTMDWLLNSFN